MDIGKDGRAEIPLPLIEERDGASFNTCSLTKTIVPFFPPIPNFFYPIPSPNIKSFLEFSKKNKIPIY